MGTESQALTVIERSAELERFLPLMDIETGLQRREVLVQAFAKLMHEGEDYGVIPGSKKPTLLQPGAQKLDNLFGLVPRFELIEKVEDWTGAQYDGEPFFRYMVRCTVMRGEFVMGEGIGECNSWESKYRYRWVPESELPRGSKDQFIAKIGSAFEFDFAINQAETTGKYGKPQEYWDEFRSAIAEGRAVKTQKETKKGLRPGYEIDSTIYRIPNPDVHDQVNTVLKIAQKRGHMAATINATSASEFVTQDLEDRVADVEPQQRVGQPAASVPRQSRAEAQSKGAAPLAAPARPIPEELVLAFQQIDKGDKTVIGPLFNTYEKELVGIYGTLECGDGSPLAPGLDIYNGIVTAARAKYPGQIPLNVIKDMLIDLQIEMEKAQKARGQRVADEIAKGESNAR